MDVLKKYVDRGIVDYRNMSSGPGGTSRLQRIWLNDCLDEIVNQGTLRDRGFRWVILTDMDEFVFPTQADLTLSQALESTYHNELCVRMYRLTFGSSFWQHRPPQGLTIENYLLRAPHKKGESHQLTFCS